MPGVKGVLHPGTSEDGWVHLLGTFGVAPARKRRPRGAVVQVRAKLVERISAATGLIREEANLIPELRCIQMWIDRNPPSAAEEKDAWNKAKDRVRNPTEEANKEHWFDCLAQEWGTFITRQMIPPAEAPADEGDTVGGNDGHDEGDTVGRVGDNEGGPAPKRRRCEGGLLNTPTVEIAVTAAVTAVVIGATNNKLLHIPVLDAGSVCRLDADSLGAGSFGEVHLGYLKPSPPHPPSSLPLPVAIKVTDAQEAMDEVAVLERVGLSEHVVGVYGRISPDAHPSGLPLASLVLEWAGGGSLRGLLQKCAGGLQQDLAMRFLRGMVCGVAAMHSVSLIHRDLKPDNVLIVGKTAKVADFGMTVGRGVEEPPMGTPQYYSPALECAAREGRRLPAEVGWDLWALGLCLRESLGVSDGVVPQGFGSAALLLRDEERNNKRPGAEAALGVLETLPLP